MDLTCYRPVIPLCCTRKVLEKTLFAEVTKLQPNEFGKRRSAALQIMCSFDQIHKSNYLESVSELSDLFLNFTITSDTVTHKKLLNKQRLI